MKGYGNPAPVLMLVMPMASRLTNQDEPVALKRRHQSPCGE